MIKSKNYFKLCFLIFANFLFTISDNIPEGFVNVSDIDPSIIVNLKYFTKDNFVGKKIIGYNANIAYLKNKTAHALAKVQKKFLSKGYSIVIYDAYRPNKSVQYFMEWVKNETDIERKDYHYPNVTKTEMPELYISSRSQHSKGTTVDISIIKTNKQLDRNPNWVERYFNGQKYFYMNDNTIDCGTSFDLLDPASYSVNNTFNFTELQKFNRLFIKGIMESVGFEVLNEEWWHFRYKWEGEDETIYDFNIE